MDFVKDSERTAALRPGRARRFVFGVIAPTVGPILLLLLEEGVLRAAVKTSETDFFVPLEAGPGGVTVYTTNDRFALQFFPAALARIPRPARIVFPKPDGVYRVLVQGGSAVMREPKPTFCFGRVLQAMLEQQGSGKIEVINAALGTINSHVVYQIGKEVDRIEPDLVVVYLGNNEVVGPYGAGTVFGSFSPDLWTIRMGIALRKTRVGQLIEHLIGKGQAQFVAEGLGMSMFLEQRVHYDDPRLQWVYEHFERNLEDLADEVAGSGATLVVSTVGSNLADLPPFASALNVDEDEPVRWQQFYDGGRVREDEGRHDEAIEAHRRAIEIYDGHALSHYHLSRLLHRKGRTEEARSHAVRARDHDTLRFRADTRLNEIIRQVGQRDDVVLVDGMVALAAAANGLPGNDHFFEHVHLTLEGNWVIARAVFQAVRAATSNTWSGVVPDIKACADRLALTPWDRYRTEVGMAGLMRRAPFTLQDGHRARRRATNLRVLTTRAVATTERALAKAAEHYGRIVAAHPGDLDVRENFARLLHKQGDLVEAARQWRSLTEAVPSVSWQLGLATVLSDQGAHHTAVHLYRESQRRIPDLTLLNIQIGYDLVAVGRLEEAVEELEDGLERNPGSTIARLNLSALLTDLDRLNEARKVLTEGLVYAHHTRDLQAEADLLVGQAEQEVREGRVEAAVNHLRRAKAASSRFETTRAW
tara:strand:+ start:2244 stop:4352 length:2109 start_codon:yes stop_codon:yes gene_type:complete